MELLLIVVVLSLLVVATYGGYVYGRTRVPRVEPNEDLIELALIKDQLEHPPLRHEHAWKHKPDVDKMGWKRFRCAYADCPAFEWRPV